MILSFMCDIHLPYIEGSSQHNAFDWATNLAEKGRAGVVIVSGDFTANGDIRAAEYYKQKINKLNIPVITMIGNSDLRDPKTREYIKEMRSPSKNVINGQVIYAVNDGEGQVCDDEINELYALDSDAIVVMHHPIEDLFEPSKEKMLKWRESHSENLLFCAHRHINKIEGNTIYLQALDPDKAIGNSPSVTHFNTRDNIASNALYRCSPPKDIFDYIGISCFYPKEDISYARKNQIRCIELRDTVIDCDFDEIVKEVELWRYYGGTNLSMHAPEVTLEDAIRGENEEWNKFILLANKIDADRITLHVPKTSVEVIKSSPDAIKHITSFLSSYFSKLKNSCVIGVENMHMTSADNTDDTRRFGYTPQEVIEFMTQLDKSITQTVGINFDTGHARNNAPFSQKYTVGAWYAEVGEYTVGYHIHQVTLKGEKFNNHMPIEHPYGKLISLASFFDCWEHGTINKAPIICEIRGDGSQGAYETTIEMFSRLKRIFGVDDDE